MRDLVESCRLYLYPISLRRNLFDEGLGTAEHKGDEGEEDVGGNPARVAQADHGTDPRRLRLRHRELRPPQDCSRCRGPLAARLIFMREMKRKKILPQVSAYHRNIWK